MRSTTTALAAQSTVKMPLLLTAAVTLVGIEVLLAWRDGFGVDFVPDAFFGALVVVLSATDLATRRLPNRLLWPSYPVGAGLLCLAATDGDQWGSLGRTFLAAVSVGVGFLLVAVLAPGQIGLGDVRLAGLVGMFCGFVSWRAVLLGLLFAFGSAALLTLPAIVAGRLGWRDRVSFGPFLLAGALAAILLR